MELLVSPTGTVQCLYGEEIDLAALGRLSIRRASHVEPDQDGQWLADLGPVGGPMLGPFRLRRQALEAEQRWLEQHWLVPPGHHGHL
jgi:hypothetical protein